MPLIVAVGKRNDACKAMGRVTEEITVDTVEPPGGTSLSLRCKIQN